LSASQRTDPAPVASPCNRVCRLDDATGCCVGCGRTLDEIARWAAMGDDERRRVCERLPARLARRLRPGGGG
jgi:predicted Fe-S protein YdhL (DUF1289 family)